MYYIYRDREREKVIFFKITFIMFVDEYVFSLYHYGQQTLNYCRRHNLPHTILSGFLNACLML